MAVLVYFNFCFFAVVESRLEYLYYMHTTYVLAADCSSVVDWNMLLILYYRTIGAR